MAFSCRARLLFHSRLFNSPYKIQTRCINFDDLIINPRRVEKKKPISKKSAKPSFRLVDVTRVRVEGGHGGKGSLSMHILNGYKRKPDGGHGGNGGSVILVADERHHSLKWSHPHVQAPNGKNGSSSEMFGRNGENLIVRVPCGVVVKRVLEPHEEWDPVNQKVVTHHTNDTEFVQEFVEESADELYDNMDDDVDVRKLSAGLEIDVHPEGQSGANAADNYDSDSDEIDDKQRKTITLADLDEPGAHIMVARGGSGGFGTCIFAKQHGPLPDESILRKNAVAKPGEKAFLELELKLIADLGLVGFPNAGKSSLLRAMSRATPEVAPYPFTTLHPMIGCIEYADGFQVRTADIPGLIGGASEGRGKGHDFLRHIERTKALLYIVDAAGVDYRNPIEDLRILADELGSYGDGSLLNRRALIVANKVDLLHREEVLQITERLQDVAEDAGIISNDEVIAVSAGVTGYGLDKLSRAIRNVVMLGDTDYNAI